MGGTGSGRWVGGEAGGARGGGPRPCALWGAEAKSMQVRHPRRRPAL